MLPELVPDVIMFILWTGVMLVVHLHLWKEEEQGTSSLFMPLFQCQRRVIARCDPGYTGEELRTTTRHQQKA